MTHFDPAPYEADAACAKDALIKAGVKDGIVQIRPTWDGRLPDGGRRNCNLYIGKKSGSGAFLTPDMTPEDRRRAIDKTIAFAMGQGYYA